MKRRDALTALTTIGTLGAAATASSLVGCIPRRRRDDKGGTRVRLKWRMASSFPRSLDVLYDINDVFAQRVLDLTDGAFEIRPSPAGELVPALQVLDAVQQGAVQMGHTASYYFDGKNPALVFDAGVPFGFIERQQMAWMFHGGGLDLLRKRFADFNIVQFPGGSTGVQMGGWFRKDVNSLADLAGLTMRIPGYGGKVMDRLGVAVQVLSGAEVYPALERGSIDATEWTGPHDDEKLGFYKVTKRYYYPGWWEPGPTISYYANKSEYEKLPKDYQSAIAVAAHEVHNLMVARYDALNPAALLRLVNQHGVTPLPFPADVMAAAKRESLALLEETAAREPDFREVYQSFKTFRDASAPWFRVAELSYMNAALAT